MLVNGALIRQLGTLDSGDMAPNEPMMNAFKASTEEFKKVELAWKTLNDKDLVALNAVLTKNNLKALAPTLEANRVVAPK